MICIHSTNLYTTITTNKTNTMQTRYMTLKKENAKLEKLNGCLERESFRRMKVITALTFKLKMYEKYEHLDLNRLRTDYDYYDCVFTEHFEMNYHNAQTTEKHILEGIEFKKMFQRPQETDDDSDSYNDNYAVHI